MTPDRITPFAPPDDHGHLRPLCRAEVAAGCCRHAEQGLPPGLHLKAVGRPCYRPGGDLPQLEEAAKRHRDLAARLTERHWLTIPAEDPVHDTSPAFPLTSAQRRTAILQPPKPEIQPSPWLLERVAGRDLDPEAAG